MGVVCRNVCEGDGAQAARPKASRRELTVIRELMPTNLDGDLDNSNYTLRLNKLVKS